jgi:glucose-6-phosphate 1-epimerase
MALQGAQVLSFKPLQQGDLLWLSPTAVLQAGQAIRGGIPVCLPWFGVNQRHPQKPKHGFARLTHWTLEHARGDDSGATGLRLGLKHYRDVPHPLFEHPFEATLHIRFGRQLSLHLEVRNCAATPMPLSWALHSYHCIDDLEQVSITGLDNTDYLDNTRQLQRYRQQGDPVFRGEFDRVYLNVGAEQTIVSHPRIRVRAVNAPSAIVWNPGADLAAGMADLGPNLHRQFVCLERGAAFDDALVLPPRATLRASINIAPAAQDNCR